MVSDSDLVARLRDILRDSDLETTTPSALRRQLEADLGVDLSDRKAFVREQIDIYLQTLGEEEAAIEDGDVADEQNGGSDEGEEDEGEDSDHKRGKKRRRSSDKGKVKKRGGFTKLCSLSQKLQDFVGVPVMARTEVVKKIWSYIREKDLQDPKDRRKILCDETLHNLFRVNTIDMFKMNKALAKHIMPLSAEDEIGLRTENEDADESSSAGEVASTSTGKEVEEEEDGGGEEEEPEVEEREIKRRGKKKKLPKEDKSVVKKKGGGFTKVCSLSPQLQSFLGESELARTEVVKRMWAYIREKNLQDPKNRRSILCDESLQVLFEVDTIDMFQMNKALSKHIWPLNGEQAASQKEKTEEMVAEESDSLEVKPEKIKMATPDSATKKVKSKKHEMPTEDEETRDEELDEAEPKEKKQKKGGGLTAPLRLSDALVKFIGTGENELSRTDVVKRMWEYIKQKGLQDPSDKRRIICDDKLKELFEVDTFIGFSVSKLLTSHFVKAEN